MNFSKKLEEIKKEIKKEIKNQQQIINEDPSEFNPDEYMHFQRSLGYQNALKDMQQQMQSAINLAEYIANDQNTQEEYQTHIKQGNDPKNHILHDALNILKEMQNNSKP